MQKHELKSLPLRVLESKKQRQSSTSCRKKRACKIPGAKKLSRHFLQPFCNNFSGNSQLFFLRFYLFIFTERGKVGEREGGKHQCVRNINWLLLAYWPTTQASVYPDQESNLLVCSVLNSMSHTSQDQTLL